MDEARQGKLPEQQTEVKPGQEGQKPGLFAKSKDFLQGAMDSISGKELPRLVEDFTRDMVIVAEGLSADQESLRSSLTIQGEEQDKLASSLREHDKKLNELAKKVDALTAYTEKRRKGDSNLLRILRQATWLAAIIGGSWIITTLIRALVK